MNIGGRTSNRAGWSDDIDDSQRADPETQSTVAFNDQDRVRHSRPSSDGQINGQDNEATDRQTTRTDQVDRLASLYRVKGIEGAIVGLARDHLATVIKNELGPPVLQWLNKHPVVTRLLMSTACGVAFMKYVPDHIKALWLWLRSNLLANITIARNDYDSLYENVMAEIMSNVQFKMRRSLKAKSAMSLRNRAFKEIPNENTVVYEAEEDAMQWFTWKEKSFILTRQPGSITIWQASWSSAEIGSFLDEVHLKAELRKQDKEVTVYKSQYTGRTLRRDPYTHADMSAQLEDPTGHGFEWVVQTSADPRSMESVSLPSRGKELLIDDIAEYLDPDPGVRQVLNDFGAGSRRGYLLYGKPGCGKTSFVRAVATKWKLKIYILSLSDPGMTDEAAMGLMRSLQKGCLLLLEDVDCAGLVRPNVSQAQKSATSTQSDDGATSSDNDSESDFEGFGQQAQRRTRDDDYNHKTKNSKKSKRKNKTIKERAPAAVTLSCMLNLFDGITGPKGYLLFMTTNHQELLDDALIREGRCSMQIEFSWAIREQIVEIFNRVYRPVRPGQQRAYDTSLVPQWAETYADRIPANTFSPAKIQTYLLRNRFVPEKMVAEAAEWAQKELDLQAIREKARQDAGLSSTN